MQRSSQQSWSSARFSFVPLAFFGVICGVFSSAETNIRQLMQNYQENQDLVANLGTQYEIVYPTQYRQDWVRGLSTREISSDGLVAHLKKTTIVIETVEYKFYIDLQLNRNLLSPTLLKILHSHDSEEIIEKEVENCYYQGVVRNHSRSATALRTCFGLTGIIYFEKEIFLIYPLHGDDSINHPHVLYHYSTGTEEPFLCGNYEPDETFHCLQEQLKKPNKDLETSKDKFVELALFLDDEFLKKYDVAGKDPVAEALQIINCANLLYRSINTSISIAYLELWIDDAVNTTRNLTLVQERMIDYVSHKLSRLSIDAAHLLTGAEFDGNVAGSSVTDSICTLNSVAISKVGNIYKPHISSFTVSHMLGHNLGMYHDHSCCQCHNDTNCMMMHSHQTVKMPSFSSCSIGDYHRTLSKGYGECLFNVPTMRESICGNRIVEDEEECDCGSTEECKKHDSCCDPLTCKFIENAECSSGLCCRNCKLLSSDYMCQPSRGECDIPDFCDGEHEWCPQDVYKKNGASCDDGFGYCYKGKCPTSKELCKVLWGPGAESANAVCYQRLNIQGTPNGNCGPDGRGGLLKCSIGDSLCGSLQCHLGQKSPISETKPVQFVVNKINVEGNIHECKAIPGMSFSKAMSYGLVKDGTKCGYQQFCVNATCIRIKADSTISCPVGGMDRLECSGHGFCTNMNTCFCDKKWSGDDCSDFIEDPIGESKASTWKDGNVTQKVSVREMVAVSTAVTSIVIAIPFIGLVIFIFFKSKAALAKRRQKK